MLLSGSIYTVRKLISILLLVVFWIPFALPAFAMGGDTDANLPACCRRNGQHHCTMMSSGEKPRNASTEKQFSALRGKCPFSPGSAPVTQENQLGIATKISFFASSATGPSAIAQGESKWRISRDRSRQKRGPPVPSLL